MSIFLDLSMLVSFLYNILHGVINFYFVYCILQLKIEGHQVVQGLINKGIGRGKIGNRLKFSLININMLLSNFYHIFTLGSPSLFLCTKRQATQNELKQASQTQKCGCSANIFLKNHLNQNHVLTSISFQLLIFGQRRKFKRASSYPGANINVLVHQPSKGP